MLYHLSTHTSFSQKIGSNECFSLNFREFLDGGIIKSDGSENKILNLKDYSTSLITSRKFDNYYYIYSPNYPVIKMEGFEMFDWDVENQTLLTADYKDNNNKEVKTATSDRFPGGVLASPYNKYLVYLMTNKLDPTAGSGNGFIMNKFNPFISDSNLVVRDTKNNQEKIILKNNYNRQLFMSFSDFSDSGNYFYTIALDGKSFKFIMISLETGEVSDFRDVFKYFDWTKINWEDFFPKSKDFSYACFSLSPDEERLVAYKNNFRVNMDNPCSADSSHTIWLFNLENGKVDIFKNQEGYITDLSWEPDGQKFALAIASHGGCYPEYIDGRIEIMDKNCGSKETLVTEPKSKITNFGWSPDGMEIAYDIYGMDLIGRLKLVNVADEGVKEIINTQTLGYKVSASEPVLLLFADWVTRE